MASSSKKSKLKHSFCDVCYGLKFSLDNLVATYAICSAENHIRFNKDGDYFGFINGWGFCVWDTFEREEKFHLEFEAHNRRSDFLFLNNVNNQSEFKIATADRGMVEIFTVTPEGSLRAKQAVLVPSDKKESIYLASCPTSETQIFCIDKGNSICQIDLRADLAVVGRYQHETLRFHTLEHDPIKSQICATGLGPYARTFDTRKLNTTLKEYKIESKVAKDDVIETCAYNYDGSEILLTDKKQDTYLIFNDNSEKNYQKYDKIAYDCQEPRFFGPKSEYLVYLDQYDLAFNDKLSAKSSAIYKLDIDWRFVKQAESFGPPAIHPNKPIFVLNIDGGPLMFCAPKGTYDTYILGYQSSSSDNDDDNDDDSDFEMYG